VKELTLGDLEVDTVGGDDPAVALTHCDEAHGRTGPPSLFRRSDLSG